MVVCTFVSMQSCGTISKFTSPAAEEPQNTGPRIDAPKFTTIDKILKLNEGMSYQETTSTLGCEPYDIYSLNDKDNKTVYIWHYKKIKRNELQETLKRRDGATSGTEVICLEEIAYLTFDNKKLISLVTDAGKGSAQRAENNAKAETAPEKMTEKPAETPKLFKLF